MENNALAQLSEGSPDEARTYLLSLVEERGTTALETLRAALEVPALAEAALDALGELPCQEAWDLLERIAREGSTRQLRKAARRTQHRLRSRGFRAVARAQREAAPAVDQAQASFFDGVGAQYLRLVRPAPLGMSRYASFIVSSEGLLDCAYTLAGRVDVEQLIAREDEHLGDSMVEMGLSYVARRVSQAADRSRERRKALPEDYLEAAPLLEDAPEDSLPEELAALGPAATPLPSSEAYRLLSHRSTGRWTLHPQRITPYLRDWRQILKRQPMQTEEGLTNLAAVQALGQLTTRIIQDLVDEAARRQLVEQLREQARLLLAMEEGALAQIAWRCAAGLEAKLTTDDPFLRALVERSMQMAIEVARKEEEEQAPWMSVEGRAGSLWMPRPADADEEEEDEGKTTSGLWLPG